MDKAQRKFSLEDCMALKKPTVQTATSLHSRKQPKKASIWRIPTNMIGEGSISFSTYWQPTAKERFDKGAFHEYLFRDNAHPIDWDIH